MTVKSETVLDYIDEIKVTGNVFREPANEYWALIYLRQGLDYLFHQIQRCEEAVRKKVNPDGKYKVALIGNAPELKDVPQGLLTCSFHWYAVSACQYVRTIGAIAYRQDSNRLLPLKYVQQVIPAVLAFRDKVAAHFAWSSKHTEDNDAERLASIISPLTFTNDVFEVGSLMVTKKSDTQISNSETIQPWSISNIHAQLNKRYWPKV